MVGGGFAGVYAYNDITRYAGLGLSAVPIVEDGMYYGATWEKVAATPDDVQIAPLDPSIIIPGGDSTQPITPIDDDPDAGIMSVPTPQYTDGDWGYDLLTENGETHCVIVSYSGAGGDIVVPATVGGYDVYRFGLFGLTATGTNNEVFNNADLANDSTLTISEGIIQIGACAVANASKFVSVSLPSTLTGIGDRAFVNATGLTGTFIIPDGVTYVGNNVFNGTNYSVMVIPESVTQIGYNVVVESVKTAIVSTDATPSSSYIFRNSSTVESVLNLSTIPYAAGSYNIPGTAVVQDNIGDSFGFIASASIVTTIDNPITPYKSLLYAIPVIILIVGLLIMAGFVIAKRDY